MRLWSSSRAAVAAIFAWTMVTQGDAAHVHVIPISNLAFGPAPADVHVNDAIEWVNGDVLQHSATASDGSFDLELPPGSRGRTALSHIGTIAYICRYHPGMAGQFRVQP